MHTALVTMMILAIHVHRQRIVASAVGSEALYKENLKRCQAFKCGAPQPRALSYQSVLGALHQIDPCEDVHPHVTLLHRCDATTGYCSSTKSSCAAHTSQNVSIAFRITQKHTSGGCRLLPAQMRYVEVAATNHTQCACEKPKQ